MTTLHFETATCLRFYTRLPVPRLPGEGDPHAVPDFAVAARAIPLAGAMVGALGAAAGALAHAAGLEPAVAATIAVATTVFATGAFHEDGLADTFDGLGGRSTEQRLTIMRDSRIGTFGACALGLSLLLRVLLLAALLRPGHGGAWAFAAALIAMHGTARIAGIMPLVLLRPARPDGAGFAAQVPPAGVVMQGCALAGLLTLLTVGTGSGLAAAVAAPLGAAVGAGLITWLGERSFGGQTGDVCGAAEQAAEIAFLMALLIFASP